MLIRFLKGFVISFVVTLGLIVLTIRMEYWHPMVIFETCRLLVAFVPAVIVGLINYRKNRGLFYGLLVGALAAETVWLTAFVYMILVFPKTAS